MEAVVFLFSLLDCCALIFLSVYFIITLSDLECDYINARSCCSKLNKWVIPEVVGHALVTVLMLVSLHWFIFLLNLPVATWNIYRFIMVPSGNMGVFDPTEIHNRGQLKSHMKEAMIKLGFYLLCFFMYLYRGFMLLTSATVAGIQGLFNGIKVLEKNIPMFKEWWSPMGLWLVGQGAHLVGSELYYLGMILALIND